MCCVSIFTCIMTMISNFLVVYIFRELFQDFFFHKYNIILHLDLILILLLLMVTFFVFKIIHTIIFKIKSMFVFSMIKCPNFWHWIPTRKMSAYFCCWRLFWIICPSTYFLIKDSCQHKLCMTFYWTSYYWLYSNILFFSNSIAIPQKIFIFT